MPLKEIRPDTMEGMTVYVAQDEYTPDSGTLDKALRCSAKCEYLATCNARSRLLWCTQHPQNLRLARSQVNFRIGSVRWTDIEVLENGIRETKAVENHCIYET